MKSPTKFNLNLIILIIEIQIHHVYKFQNSPLLINKTV